MADFLGHELCEECGKDNKAVYSDGSTYCFTYNCGDYTRGSEAATVLGENQGSNKRKPIIDPGQAMPIPARKLTKETTSKFGYTISTFAGKPVQVANYRGPKGGLVAQKLRTPDKNFIVRGDKDQMGLWGQWLWRDGGKMVVITEGEIDCMSVSQAQGNKWPVVSIPNGVSAAAKAIKRSLEWLNRFDTVILMFDNDEVGRDAAEECARVLKPGKAKIATLPLKDANEMLKAGRSGEIIDAIWGAKPYRPSGIVTLKDIRKEAMRPVEWGKPWFLEPLTKLTYGRRPGEVYTLGAGTGTGKTDFLTEQITFDITQLDEKVALFFFEQEPEETARRLAGKVGNRRFWVPDAGWTEDEYVSAYDKLSSHGNLYLYDHFGVADWDELQSMIRYIHHADDVQMIYIDHLTALADPRAERESLEVLMGELGGLVKEIPITVHLVSHLATPHGTPHEEGGRVSGRHFKGSRAIQFWSHFLFGMERNQQHPQLDIRQTTTFRIIKDRYTGQATGEVFFIGYDAEHGRLFWREDGMPEEVDGDLREHLKKEGYDIDDDTGRF